MFSSLRVVACVLTTAMFLVGHARGAIVTDPNDVRSWQGATVGTFAGLYYGSDTLANRQHVVDNQLLDDGLFNSAGFLAGSLVSNAWSNGSVSTGSSTDSTGTGSYDYVLGGNAFTAANGIDNLWLQTSGVVGQTVWDLGFQATKAAVFNTIDHGPLPQEAIESTVYLSNDLSGPWTQGVVERVWLEGFQTNTGILWDGFVFAVGTGTSDTFRYASVIHGGPGALINDGDDEINGIMGLRGDFTPSDGVVPEASSIAVWSVLGLVGSAVARKRHARFPF